MCTYKSSIDPALKPKRIVSLVPSITETIIELGAGDKLVGRTTFCIEPAGSVEHIPRVGGTKNFHTERIIELNPDLIIANKEENDRERVESLMASYPTCVYDIKNLTDALDMISHLGELTGRSDEASGTIETIKKSFNTSHPVKHRRTAAYLIWDSPIMASGGDTFIHEMVQLAGFENVFGHQRRYPTIDADGLRAAASEVLLLSSEPFPFNEKHIARYREILPHAEIRLVDGTFFSWYGSRLAKAKKYFQGLHLDSIPNGAAKL